MISLSIIIPVYKVENYIRRCLESVIAQEDSGVEMECIVIDDKGPDNSMDIVHDVISNYHGAIDFKVVVHERNRGVAAGRNTGAKMAKGEYIMFIDSDDYLKPGCVKSLLGASKDYPQADVIIGQFYSVRDQKPSYDYLSSPVLYDNKEEIHRKFLRVILDCFPWNRLLRRKLIEDNQLYFQEGTIFEDVIWSYHLFDKVNAVLLIPDITYVYENNPTSAMNSTKEKSTATVRSFVFFCNEMLDQPYKGMFVDHHLYVFNILMKAIDTRMHACVTSEVSLSLDLVRNRIFRETLLSGRIFLAMFFLTAFPPFNNILRFSWFRCHFDRLGSLIRSLTLRK